MLNPFHFSFAVPDLDAAKAFYVDVLGCSLGRDHGTWVDVLFFGHQLTIHAGADAIQSGRLDHFGPILSKSDWQALADRLHARDVEFESPPELTGAGTAAETVKYLLRDPAGNLLEFKFYHDCSAVLGRKP